MSSGREFSYNDQPNSTYVAGCVSMPDIGMLIPYLKSILMRHVKSGFSIGKGWIEEIDF